MIRRLGLQSLQMAEITIRDLTSFIGNVVASGEAVHWATLYLEVLRNEALAESYAVSDERVECLIKRWTSNIHFYIKSLNTYPDIFISTNASMSGWGYAQMTKLLVVTELNMRKTT